MNNLLADLRQQKIRVWREGENLRFSAPTGTVTPELRARMAACKVELLAGLDREAAADAPIPPVDRTGPLPLSFAQERLWVLDQIEPGLSVYNVADHWRIHGPLDVAALEWSLHELEKRHEILRTTFTQVGDQPVQIVHPPSPQSLMVVEATPAELDGFIQTEASTSFDLERGPLTRIRLVRLAAEDHALLITRHHLICDVWSNALCMKELAALYTARLENRPNPLPALPLQFADFAAWQRRNIGGPAMIAQLDYWRSQLSSDCAALALPMDRPRPARRTSAGAATSLRGTSELSSRLSRLAREEGVTLFTVLQAAWVALLARYTGEEDLCIGSPIAQRPRAETEALLGFFLNMLTLRTSAAGDPTFRELLRRTANTTLRAFENQDVPFERVVQELQPVRHSSHHPCFQVAFVLTPRAGEMPSFPNLRLERLAPAVTTAKFDLTLFTEETDDGLSTALEYATDIFDRSTAERLLASLHTLLHGIVENPDARLSELPLLTAEEEQRLLVAWNDTARPFPHDRNLPDLFAEQVARNPSAIALVDAAEEVSYAALNARANAYAAHLREQGIGAGALVSVPAERSIRFVAAALGCLKIGAAYVPLDPAMPAERLAALETPCAWKLDFAAVHAAAEVAETPPCPAAPSDPAYVMFTSGSTGIPKGVVVPHRAISRLVINSNFAPLRPDDVVAFASNVSFDAATWEIWGALLQGAKLVVTPHDVLLSPASLAAHFERYGITALFLTTALFHRFAQDEPGIFRPLRHLLFGGEACDSAAVRRVLAHGGPERLVHVYGPTETTTFALSHLVEHADGENLSLGRPIANTKAYIFDRHLRPVPVGVAGELFLGGPGLALGYHDAPALTAERFLDTPHGRLYRTGDRARWLADGTIEYLGRMDRQIKLRGFRIEPGEIEAAVRSLPGVAECVVQAGKFGRSEPRLVAWFQSSNGRTPSAPELAQGLGRKLPAYMVPATFVPVSTFPLNANGKIDFKALPAPTEVPAHEDGYVPPENSVQAQLAEIWQELLGVPRVGIRDRFFDLGGHSLLVARMLALVQTRLGVRVPLATLFEEPTIEHLARIWQEENLRAGQDAACIAIHPEGRRSPFFFLHGDFVGGGLFCRNLARHLGDDRPFYAIHPHGLSPGEAPTTIEAMARDRLAEVRALRPRGPYLLGGYCNGALVAFEMAHLLEAAGERVEALILIAADGSNVRFRWVKKLANTVSTLAGESSSDREKRTLRWLRRMRIVEAFKTHYTNAARALAKEPFGVQVQRVAHKAGRVARRLIPGGRTVCEPSLADERTPVAAAYEDALDGFVPPRFGGNVTLLWPQDDPMIGATAGWARVCARLDLRMIPGGHHDCITRDQHLLAIAEELRPILDRAASNPCPTATVPPRLS